MNTYMYNCRLLLLQSLVAWKSGNRRQHRICESHFKKFKCSETNLWLVQVNENWAVSLVGANCLTSCAMYEKFLNSWTPVMCACYTSALDCDWFVGGVLSALTSPDGPIRKKSVVGCKAFSICYLIIYPAWKNTLNYRRKISGFQNSQIHNTVTK